MPSDISNLGWLSISILITCVVSMLCSSRVIQYKKKRAVEREREALDALVASNQSHQGRVALIVLVDRSIRVPETISIVKILGAAQLQHPRGLYADLGHAMYLSAEPNEMRAWLQSQKHVWVRASMHEDWVLFDFSENSV